MDRAVAITLVVAGGLLVGLPVVVERGGAAAAHDENYRQAMERQRKAKPEWPVETMHREAVRQADELRPSPLPGYVSQAAGVGLAAAGVLLGSPVAGTLLGWRRKPTADAEPGAAVDPPRAAGH